MSNVLGGLAEVFDDYARDGTAVMPKLAGMLWTVDEGCISTSSPLEFAHAGNIIQFDMSVLIYDGPRQLTTEPFDKGEVAPVGWVTPAEFLGSNARPLAEYAVRLMHTGGIIKKKLRDYHEALSNRQRVIPEGFSLGQFYAARELIRDAVNPTMVYQAVA